METQLKDKDGLNIYPAVEGGSGGSTVESSITDTLEYTIKDCPLVDTGTIINSSGAEADTNSVNYTGWSCSGHLPVYGGSMTVCYTSYDKVDLARYAFYDENKALIGGKVFPVRPAMGTQVVHDFSDWDIKPAYVRFSYTISRGCVFSAAQPVSGNVAVDTKVNNHKKYKILWFGNSFTNNTCSHIGKICQVLGIDNVFLETFVGASNTLKHYSDLIDSDALVEAGRTVTRVIRKFDELCLGTMQNVLSHDWDMIIFQQASGSSDNYTTYEPSLTNLINAVRQYCPNKRVRIGFNMTWGIYVTRLVEYDNIANAMKQLTLHHPEVIVIPTGTAIENARRTSLNDGENFSSDYNDGKYQHVAQGVGGYAASCCFYEKILAPLTGVSIYSDNVFTHVKSGTGDTSVTDANRALCQRCAVAAIENPFEVTDPALLDPDYVAPTS